MQKRHRFLLIFVTLVVLVVCTIGVSLFLGSKFQNEKKRPLSITIPTRTNQPTFSPQTGISQTPSTPSVSGKLGWSSGYYVGWQQVGHPPQTIPWKAITQLIQFPLLPTVDGSLVPSSQLTPAFMRAAVAEAHKHNVKILMSVGGAGNNNFDVVCSPAIRNTFINNLVNLMQTYGYDGVDLDIEQDFGYPAHTDYIACVSGVRSALDKITPLPILSMAADPDWQPYMASQVWQYVDQINLMSYGTNVNGIGAKLHNFTDRGIPKSKLGIGIGIEDGGVDGSNIADCGAKAQYAVTNGYGGVMEWTLTADQILHSEQTPCLDAVANYVYHMKLNNK
jgi:GH18 family chitinase